MNRRLFEISLLFLLFALSAGCSQPQSLGPQAMQGAMAGEPLGDYRLRPGDVIELKFFNHSFLNAEVAVGPDGKISLELLDQVLVAGLTVSQVDELITQEYARQLENLEVAVIMRKYSGLRAYVGGEVQSPGFVSLVGNKSVLEAILEREGFTEQAKPESVILLRKGPGSKPMATVINLGPVISGEQIENDIYLVPSDIVYIPKTAIAKAGKFVDQYIRKVLMFDQVIIGAGQALGWYFVKMDVYHDTE